VGRQKKIDISPEALDELRAIGARLRAAREAQGISQTTAAERTAASPWGEITQAGWSRIEVADVLPTVLQLRAAAEAVGLPVSAVAFGEPDTRVSDAALLIDRFLASGNLAAAMNVLATQLPKLPRK
jgi:transcriptional regulator with XRE-family HTH domain